ncbi:nucleotidyltransferase domain-containing protein [Candidatus Woesearchaeota archaeon]|nr:nucleotidyltransferase domain-containing protein [Candidatus Woesearchaeota archaeon]
MLTQTKEKQIQWMLTHPDEKVTISRLAIGSGTAYPQTYNNVQDLVQERIFVTENVASAKVVTIPPDAPLDILLSVEAKRKQEFLQKYLWVELMLKDILDYTHDYFFILVVFGSYAKGTQTSKSDLDLLLIVPSKEKISLFESAASKIYTKVKKDVTTVTADEFMEMIKSNKFNVGTEAKKYHILLYGAEQWYNLTRKVQ